MSTRPIPLPDFAGDDGAPDPALAAALAAAAADAGRRPEVLASMHTARVLAPVVAGLGPEPPADLAQGEKSSDISVPLLVGEDGRLALPVFSGVPAMQRWDAGARPVPLLGGQAALVAASEGAPALVVDVAGPWPGVLREPEVEALASGRGRQPMYQDALLGQAIAQIVAAEPAVMAAYLVPWPDTDARLVVLVAANDDAGLRGTADRLAKALGDRPELVAAQVVGLDLAVIADPTELPEGRPLYARADSRE
jgi:hypothetical protein